MRYFPPLDSSDDEFIKSVNEELSDSEKELTEIEEKVKLNKVFQSKITFSSSVIFLYLYFTVQYIFIKLNI